MNNRDTFRRTRGLLSLASCRRGGIAIIGVLSTTALIAIVGIGVDLTRLMLVKSRLQTSVDAAALVAGRGINPTSGKVDATAQADARALFWSNFDRAGTGTDPARKGYTGYLGATATADPDITSPTNDTVLIRATVTVKTTFMSVVGATGSNVSAQATAKRQALGMELALVLDITGSMGRTFQSDGTLDPTTNINIMRAAATNLVNIVYGSNDTVPNLYTSVTTFTAGVNIGPNNSGWLKSGSLDQSKYSTSGWAGCIEARANGEDQTDTPPTTSPFVPYLYKSTLGKYFKGVVPVKGDNDWAPGLITEKQEATLPDNTAVGPNLACAAIPIQALTPNKSKVMAVINNFVSTYRGGTTGDLGMQAGWWTLSPQWAGLWTGTPTTGLPNNATSLPLPYNSSQMQKVVVFMTDGAQQWYDWPGGAPGAAPSPYDGQAVDADYTAYGRLSENRLGITIPNTGNVGNDTNTAIGNAKAELDNRVANLCTKMKKQGIIIYTVTFSHGGIDNATKALWQGCATDTSHYFDSPTSADLASAFQQIGTQLTSLRLTL